MNSDLTYEVAARWYWFALDALNVMKLMNERELKNLFDKSHRNILFIDCYDLISLLFEKEKVVYDEHHDWNKAIWSDTIDNLQSDDNLKICLSPPSCLELFHYLSNKAFFVSDMVPTITDEDIKLNRFWPKLAKNHHALSITSNLMDAHTNTIPSLSLLKSFINQNKFVNACDVFDYSKPDWESLGKNAMGQFDSAGAMQYLKKHRRGRARKPSKSTYNNPFILDEDDEFSINVDILNILETIYINSKSTNNCTFTGHGVYLTLCCHRQSGFWKDKTQDAPVANSILALFLARSLRLFNDYKEALEAFDEAKKIFQRYLTEMTKLEDNNLGLIDYFYNRNLHQYRKMKNNIISKTLKFIAAEMYLKNFCDFCIPGALVTQSDQILVLPSKAILLEREKDKIIEFAKDEKGRKEKAEQLLEAAKNSFQDLNLLNEDSVSNAFLPPGEYTTKLLMQLRGYSYKDWRK